MKAFDSQSTFQKTTLTNGVRVVTEHHPFMRSVSAGIYVDLGSRDEPENMSGAAHFIEHLVFKGTKKRTGFEIAKSLEAVGGDLNAYTSREYTCFNAITLSEHLPLAMDVLADLISHAKFSMDDFTLERDVVLHEIDMSMDDLEEYIFDLYFEEVYKGHPLGRSILGTEETLSQMRRQQIAKYYRSRYCGRNLVVSVVGNVNHEEVVKIVSRSLLSHQGRVPLNRRKSPRLKPFRKYVHRPSEQVHILIGAPSCSFKQRQRFESYIVSAVLGGGMTSRLYQAIREKRGLAYSVYSYLFSFTDTGILNFYASTSQQNVGRVMELIYKEVFALKARGLSHRELNLFKTQVKGQILLGADDSENRMNSLAINEMTFGKYRSVEAVINDIDAITVDSIQQYMNRYLKEKNLGIMLMGDLEANAAKDLLTQF